METTVITPHISTVDEALETRSPQEVEKDLLLSAEQQALDEFNKLSPQQRAAINFKMLYPTFRQSISKMNNKDLRRLTENLVLGNLTSETPKLKKPVSDALKFGQMLIDFRLIINGLDHLEQLEKIHAQSETSNNNPFAPEDVITTIEYPGSETTKENTINT